MLNFGGCEAICPNVWKCCRGGCDLGWTWLEAAKFPIRLGQIIIQGIGTLFSLKPWIYFKCDFEMTGGGSHHSTLLRSAGNDNHPMATDGSDMWWAPGARAIHPWIPVRSSEELPCRRCQTRLLNYCHKVHLGKTICQSGTCHFECTRNGTFVAFFHLGGFCLEVVYSDWMQHHQLKSRSPSLLDMHTVHGVIH